TFASRSLVGSCEGMRISFGPFAFDPHNRLLWRDGTEIALPPRVLGVLEALIERAGEVVARQDLLDRVWKDAFVTDTSLAAAISFPPPARGAAPHSPRYIQTVHRRGYRFLPMPTASGLTPAAPGAGARGQSPDAGETPEAEAFTYDRASNRGAQKVGARSVSDWRLVPRSVALPSARLPA